MIFGEESTTMNLIFYVSGFVIFWGMIGYGISLKLISKILKKRKLVKDYQFKPTVTVMIVAHNEEKIIRKKLINIINNDYPKNKIDYIITSDCSTDKTNEIVRGFIKNNKDLKIKLHVAENHMGKTNAQNEAQKQVKGEILVLTDANAMFRKNSISELVACFTSDDIAYVTGKLQYINSELNQTASSESFYWKYDLTQRMIESNIWTITAGNGAIYACRNADYVDCKPIDCHDAKMPYYFAGKGKRSIYNPDALAFEKAGEIDEDEFKRKVRMNRGILSALTEGIYSLNIKKYGWFSYFYFGHRTCRYLLWLAHFLLYVSNAFMVKKRMFYRLCFVGQTLFYVVGFWSHINKSKNKLVHLIYYYCMTILAQWIGVYHCLTGKSKAVWEKAESTR